MKKILYAAALLVFINHASAQNTFPTGVGTNVGINIASPIYPLDVRGDVNIGTLLRFANNTVTTFGTTDAHPTIYSTAATGTAYPFLGAGNLVLQARSSTSARDIVFVGSLTPAVQMIIQGSTGNVGIGTTTPATLSVLQVQKNINNPTIGSFVNTDPGLSAKALVSVGSTAATGSTFGSFEYLGAGRTATGLLAADRTMLRGNGPGGLMVTAENVAGNIAFATGGTSGNNVRMQISSDGNIGVGITAPTNKLHIVDVTGTKTANLQLSTNVLNETIGLSFGTQPGDRTKAAVAGVNTNTGNAGGALAFYTNAGASLAEKMRITSDGNVGIGTTAPENPLQVSTKFAANASGVVYWGNNITAASPSNRGLLSWDIGKVLIGSPDASTDVAFVTSGNTERMRILSGGNIGIGTTDTKGYKLAVNGSVIATAVTVKLYNEWADYVFNDDYKLLSLTEVKKYIDKNHHLPDMPSAAQVQKDGLNLGEINTALTRKVEELTLYLIEKNEQLNKQQKEIDLLKEQFKSFLNADKKQTPNK